MQLIDHYQRRFQYLRLSITEKCNFSCQYCLPNGYQADKTHRFLSLTEIKHVLDGFVSLGVKKVRLTGGEPTLRRDFNDILSLLADYPEIVTRALTTNGFRLEKLAAQWQQAGLNAVNISIDSLSPQQFKSITGQDKLQAILRGVDKALACGIEKVKVNSVLIKGLNDRIDDYLPWLSTRPIELRFIELMETGNQDTFFERYHTPGQLVESALLARGWQLEARQALAGPAKVYTHAAYLGKIGLIMPYSKNFCQDCNRLRVSSIGKLHYCLFGEAAIELRDLLCRPEQLPLLQQRILSSLLIKPESHYLAQHKTGLIQNLSFIGG